MVVLANHAIHHLCIERRALEVDAPHGLGHLGAQFLTAGVVLCAALQHTPGVVGRLVRRRKLGKHRVVREELVCLWQQAFPERGGHFAPRTVLHVELGPRVGHGRFDLHVLEADVIRVAHVETVGGKRHPVEHERLWICAVLLWHNVRRLLRRSAARSDKRNVAQGDVARTARWHSVARRHARDGRRDASVARASHVLDQDVAKVRVALALRTVTIAVADEDRRHVPFHLDVADRHVLHAPAIHDLQRKTGDAAVAVRYARHLFPPVPSPCAGRTDNDAKILIYEFKHGGEQFYRDAYDEKFNLIFEKIESCSYEDDCEFISVNRKDSGIYDEGNYFDGLYTTLYDENFNVVKKFDAIKEISAGYYNKKDCYFVDDYGYSGHMDDGLYREIYDKDFKLIKDNIIDMSSFKNPNNNIIYIIITDGVSTKIYKDDKLVKDLKYRLLNTHRDYETIEFILKFDNQYSDYFRGVYPIIYLKDKIFIRTNDGAKVLDDKFEIKLEGYKEFIDFNEEYFTFFKDKSYGFMDFNLKELVKFDRK